VDKKVIKEYQDYINKIGNRKELYRIVADEYDIKIAIYPGSHIDIAPSMVIPKVIYIDNFKGAIKFFKHLDSIKEYIEKNKEYSAPAEIKFLGQDYNQPLDIEKVDLIISQYAGFVGQAAKDSLKIGGILLCNDSHGDASLAKLDQDYKLIAVIENNKIKKDNLEEYFKLANGKPVDIKQVKEKMKGLKYEKMAGNYLFRKVK
jgi:SAM-dependent methyltransferase